MPNNKKIYGIIGYPIEHSLSPAMHNAAFKYLKDQGIINYDAEYKRFEIKPTELKDFLLGNIIIRDREGNSFYSQEIEGFNITIPHKVPSLLKDKIIQTSPSVVLTGSVNTVKRFDNKLYYYNTDVEGFIESLRRDLKFDWNNKNIFIFGCGGAARAVVAGLMPQDGAKAKKIYIYEPNEQVRVFAKKHFDDLELTNLDFIIEPEEISAKISDSQLLVNATPLGMKDGDPSIIDNELLHDDLYIFDVVYNRETQLVRDAKSRNLKAVGGLGMLLYQGILAFEIWTNQRAPEEIMRKALKEVLGKQIGE